MFFVSFWDSQRLSRSQELTLTLTLGLSLGLGLAKGHFKDKNIFIYTTFKDFSLDVYDDIDVLHLVSDSQRFSYSQEFTLTVTLGFSLGLGLAEGHFEDKKIFIYTTFKDFSWASTTIFMFSIWFEILNAYSFPRS